MSKFRNFAFTHNNYTDTDLEDGLDCKYIIYGREVGDSGTPHLQGTVVFKTQRSLSAVIKSLPGCHVEVARDVFASIEYCRKDGDFVERGTPPLKAAAAAFKGIAERWELAKQGRFEELPPEHIRTYEYVKRKFTECESWVPMAHEWRYGASGAGKSRSAREEYPDAYIKDASKWWDGYDHQEVVIIEDWDPKCSEYLTRYLKIWSDHYHFPAEVKGGKLTIRPKKIIVTSQYPIDACFLDSESYDAINRRFKSMHYHKI